MKNSDKLSAYILVNHALLFSAMLESNLAPKGSPTTRLHQIFMLLHLCMPPYAYTYHTCKHPCVCAFAYACVIRVNQALHSARECFSQCFDAVWDSYLLMVMSHLVTKSGALVKLVLSNLLLSMGKYVFNTKCC